MFIQPKNTPFIDGTNNFIIGEYRHQCGESVKAVVQPAGPKVGGGVACGQRQVGADGGGVALPTSIRTLSL